MKLLKIFIFAIFLLVPMTVMATGVSQEVEDASQGTENISQSDIQEELFSQFDFSEINGMLDEIFPNEKMNFLDTITGLISGDLEFSFELIKQFIWDQLAYEVENSRTGIIHILLLVIIAAIFTNFSGMFKSTQVSEISFFMLYMLLITICLNNFRVLADAVSVNLEKLMEFMRLLGPIYFFAVGMATGSSTSITFYQLVLLLVFMVELLVLNFLIPVTQIYLIMRILGELSPEIHLSKFAELLETIVNWALKALMAGIVGLNVIQSLISPAIDSVKRSLVTKSGEALPVIGDVIGGATEIVLGTAVLIKNGIGVAGMLVCLAVCLTPIIQMAVTTLMYQLVAALMQPISDKRMVNCVSSMADGTKMLLRVIVTTGVLFMLTIAVVATTTGG